MPCCFDGVAKRPAGIAFSNTTVTIGDNVTQQVKSVVCSLLPQFRKVAKKDFRVISVTGGITNLLFKVESTGSNAPNPVLVRIFGEAGDKVCDRVAENLVFAELAEKELAPKLLGTFANGRVEEFYEGMRSLDPEEMLSDTNVPRIARQLAAMHAFVPRRLKRGMEILLWEQLDGWLKTARGVSFQDPAQAKRLQELDLDLIEQELQWVRQQLPSPDNNWGAALLKSANSESGDPTFRAAQQALYQPVFCHNDLLAGNVMVPIGKAQICRFIDFEYASVNSAGLDIANHFTAAPESYLITFGTLDPDKDFPKPEVIEKWMEFYFDGRAHPSAHDPVFLRNCREVTMGFVLAAELRWVIWGVIQAGYSPVADFDYLDYCNQRFNRGYMKYKEWYLKGSGSGGEECSIQ
mmetsp:Transcript_131879/g.299823  ORF Transcript_131879/g.299823 Transcript_131879/m.299823 type:complete len:407 (-) Transcript_131879:133-1353(-)